MRIGVNHGSLSDRIMNRYGDTPIGMVESALEYTRLARELDYHELIFSMKSSNPLVMIEAYRLLVQKLDALGWNYPLHLGVTEAGEGEDGRVKSAIGIGALLLEGIGDTIRVSLTEDPWHEILPCKQLIALSQQAGSEYTGPFQRHERQKVTWPTSLPWHPDGAVLLALSQTALEASNPLLTASLGFHEKEGVLTASRQAVDAVLLPVETTRGLMGQGIWSKLKEAGLTLLGSESLKNLKCLRLTDEPVEHYDALFEPPPALIFLSPTKNRLSYAHQLMQWLESRGLHIPMILEFSYTCARDALVIEAAAELGGLLCDGIGDGICITGEYPPHLLRQLQFTIMQAARRRTVRTDFISCPSCGRTLFNLQEVAARIRDKTAHLPGVKIAIMGCIVNGPGEMADADFGYVGSKPGKIDLYVGKQCVQKDIPAEEADEALIALIRAHGRWVEAAVSI